MNQLASFTNWVRTQVAESGKKGQGMVEYALILILIAIVVIVILIVLGNQVQNMYSDIASGLST